MSRTAHVIANDGTITLIHQNQVHTIGPDHVKYSRIVSALKARHYERLDKLIDITAQIKKIENITVKEGRVFWKDKELHGLIAQKILDFIRENAPIRPLALFIENLMANPSARSVNELYKFLEHKGFPITDDGCFLAYKGINNDWTDIYTGKVNNSVGQVVEFQRNEVDDNCNNTCSFGLHVGTFDYAADYSGDRRIVVVKVNPADAVSVPSDHDAQKLRVTRYEVVREATNRQPTLAIHEGHELSEDDGYTWDDAFDEDE